MQKSVSVEYGSIDLSTSITPGNLVVTLLAPDDQPVANVHVPQGTAVVNVPVSAGNGWRIQLRNLDQNGNILPGTAPIIAAPGAFDVVESQTVQVAIAATITS